MRGKQVQRMYGELDGAERLRLALAAVAGGNAREAERVVGTSPKIHVLQREPVVDQGIRAGLGLGWWLGIRAAAGIGALDGLAPGQGRGGAGPARGRVRAAGASLSSASAAAPTTSVATTKKNRNPIPRTAGAMTGTA